MSWILGTLAAVVRTAIVFVEGLAVGLLLMANFAAGMLGTVMIPIAAYYAWKRKWKEAGAMLAGGCLFVLVWYVLSTMAHHFLGI